MQCVSGARLRCASSGVLRGIKVSGKVECGSEGAGLRRGSSWEDIPLRKEREIKEDGKQ